MLRGMLGWVNALPILEPISVEETKYSEDEFIQENLTVPSENYTEVVNVLSNMVISNLGRYL